MSFYNLMRAEDRKRKRADCQAELDAVEAGKWPRDINDQMRWSDGQPETAVRCCKAEIEYLDGVEQRIVAGDPSVDGWEPGIPEGS